MRITRTLYSNAAASDGANAYYVPANQTLRQVYWAVGAQSASGVAIDGRAFLSYNATAGSSQSDQAVGNISMMKLTATLVAATVVRAFDNMMHDLPGGLQLHTGEKLYINTTGTFANFDVICMLVFD